MKQFAFPILVITILATQTARGQVPKKTMVEHFTNTKCSVCAARNPGFYVNLNNQQNTLHLAIHPSAPYSACLLYNQNAIENDARTNFYGVYGSTPRLVINGDVILNSSDYSHNGIFAPYQSLTSPASIKIAQYKYGADSIRATIVIKTVATHTLGSVSLFVALAEDTVFYKGSNGEPKHFGVFRKSLTGTTGNVVTLPASVGDSVVFSSAVPANPVWNFKRIYTIAILQETGNKDLVQAEASDAKLNMVPMGLNENNLPTGFNVFPNPAQSRATVESMKPLGTLKIANALGEVIYSEEVNANSKELDLGSNSCGIYFIYTLKNNKLESMRRIVIIR